MFIPFRRRINTQFPRALASSTADWPDGIVVLANRAPVRHEDGTKKTIRTVRSASGLVTALEPLIERKGGVWVAHGAGAADKRAVDSRDGVRVPAGKPRYRLRYVWLDDATHRGYYFGFANEGLWPLCHDVNVTPQFRDDDFAMYHAANEQFAAAVADEARGRHPLVLVQDYHFALAPRMIRRTMPASPILTFWHIPWPRPRTLRACPWAFELLDGLLASDVIGVQTDEDRFNFLACIESFVDAQVDYTMHTVRYRDHRTAVRVCPVGVDPANHAARSAPPVHVCRAMLRRDLSVADHALVGIGIDRLDYTKGIQQKFLAVERLLERHPDLPGRFVFLQVAEPSRDCLPAYQQAREEIVATRDRVNARFGTATYQPIHLREHHHDAADVYALYRAADFCFVGSLHDGMNLVAKEFVAARTDEQGVLVLSETAGAAHQLRAALLVNPRAIDQSANALAQAIAMSTAEQMKRMRLLRANVTTYDARWWAEHLVTETLGMCRHRQTAGTTHLGQLPSGQQVIWSLGH
ncbi:MAG: trehalose-6-phosphate synthase [Acidobacteriaceae bacterium]|jgi:trehalose 6-phosphate synthase|nr:trehalose-6-phosphate synthase [Acidobacteriaceae bacterium]